MLEQFGLSLALTFAVFLLLSVAIWKAARPGSLAAWLIRPLVVYLGFAFVIKAFTYSAFGWTTAWEAGAVASIPSREQANNIIDMNLIYVSGVLAAILVALSTSPIARQIHPQAPRPALNSTPLRWHILFYSMVAMKLFAAFVLDWGRPGLTPSFSIPLVTGFINILSKDGLTTVFAIITITEARSAVSSKVLRGSFYWILLTYVASDLVLGWKTNLVFGAIGLLYFLYMQARMSNMGYVRFAFLALAITVVFPSLYLFMNIFRFVRLDDSMSFIEAVKFTQEYIRSSSGILAESSGSEWQMFLVRLTGIEGIAAAVSLEHFDFPLLDLFFMTDINQRYTEAITGVGDGSFAVGGTIAGTVYLISEGQLQDAFLIIFVINVLFFVAMFAVLSLLSRMALVGIGATLSLAFVTIHMQLATGALIMFLDRIIVILVIAFLMHVIGSPRRKYNARPRRSHAF